MEAIISDFTGKTVNKKQSYKISITSRSNNAHLDFDGTREDLESNKIWDSIKLAIQNGSEWYSLRKNPTTEKWERVTIEPEVEPKND